MEIARTFLKKESRDGQERSLRGTESVERGMATKRVVRERMWGGRRVDWEGREVVGVEEREGLGEKGEGLRGEERVD